ncbi:UvrD-helicase domain-containing protein [Acidithiobacillus sp.]|uniref:UvrD-helicase domain-containing protein n=1 Tax=Acidithiobacillus sp. TaxID=1872118 RepID=UPI0025C332E9|nr:UvrD-helicase domain-containing protein [Acidithiobacillus sp.]
MSASLADLNGPQRDAVARVHGPVLVLAGAGSGKTRVITRKIVHLIEDHGVEPRHIAAVTFTNKAAREMKGRVQKSLEGRSVRGLTISTFHRLGLEILRRDITQLGYRENFSVIDPGDSLSMVRNLLREMQGPSDLAESIQARISRAKNDGHEPEDMPLQDRLDELAQSIYRPYQRALKACNSVDLDDLILLPTQLLSSSSEAQERWQERIRYLLVDEYQDSNGAQYRLLRSLLRKRQNLTAVGDDDQSIYSWRGAAADNLQRLAQDFPDLKVIKLEQNYRSTGRILHAANHLIAHNPHLFEKKLWSSLGDGERIQVIVANDEADEAEQVVNAILRDRFQRQGEYRDYAILYRSNHQSRPFETALRNARIPYQISGGLSFFERSEIRDFLAYCRLLVNPDDDAAFLRAVNTPRRGIGSATLETLGELAKARQISLFAAVWEEDLTLAERPLLALRSFADWLNRTSEACAKSEILPTLRDLLEEIGYRQYLENEGDEREARRKWENLEELLAWMARLQEQEDGPENLAELLNRLSVIHILERDDEDEDRDVLRLSTLHGAKGLEFSRVFLVGIEEELLPHRNSESPAQIEEERRLFYVGVTRARHKLALSYCRRRKRYGEMLSPEPSRFLQELPKDLLDWQGGSQREEGEDLTADAACARLRALLDD